MKKKSFQEIFCSHEINKSFFCYFLFLCDSFHPGELYFKQEKMRGWSGVPQPNINNFEKIRTVGKGILTVKCNSYMPVPLCKILA